MTEYVPGVGDTATFIRKMGVSVRGTVQEITEKSYILIDTTDHMRTINKNVVRKILQ